MLRMWVTIALVTACGGAGTTRPGKVDALLDRARESIAASAKRAPTTQATLLPHEIELAGELVRLRGNDADRRLLAEVIEHPPMPADFNEARDLFGLHYLRALGFAALGQNADARKELEEAERFTAEPKAKLQWAGALVSWMLSRGWAAVGDVEKARQIALREPLPFSDRVDSLADLAGAFHDAGNTAARDQVLAEATKAAMEMKEPGPELRTIAQELAKEGRLGDAEAVAAKMPAESARCDAYQALALIYFYRGEAEGVSRSLSAATDTVAKIRNGEFQYEDVARTGARFGDRAAVERAAAAAERSIELDHSESRARRWAGLARDCAVVGLVDRAKQYAQAARAVLGQLGDVKEKARVLITLAAVDVYLGAGERAEAGLKESVKLDKAKYSWSDEFAELVLAWVAVGRAEKALGLTKEFKFADRDVDFVYKRMAERASRSSHFAQAVSAARGISRGMERVQALAAIASAQARRGEGEAAAAWVAQVEDPQARAVLYLVLARRELGLPRGWFARLLDVH